jgi:hypothetical protein
MITQRRQPVGISRVREGSFSLLAVSGQKSRD